MYTLNIIAILIIAVSIIIVWVFRFENLVKEFKEYGIPDLLRNMVGAAKIAISTLLVAGIWYPALAGVPALLMAFLMVCAQFAHVKTNHTIIKYLPSAGLLILSLFVAAVNLGWI